MKSDFMTAGELEFLMAALGPSIAKGAVVIMDSFQTSGPTSKDQTMVGKGEVLRRLGQTEEPQAEDFKVGSMSVESLFLETAGGFKFGTG
jgi:hypothetical protein